VPASEHPNPARLARLSSLDDSLRRRLYAYVRDQPGAVSRDEAADATGITRSLAAYHLDKLTAAGLLSVGYQRPGGRTGPGAGRPAKVYLADHDEISVSVPPRDYELLARLLVESAERDETGSVQAAIAATAADAGRRTAVAAQEDLPAGTDRDEVLRSALHSAGYEPTGGGTDDIELRNCPFHRLAREHPQTVCRLNLDLICGLLDGAGTDTTRAELRPSPNHCCVVIHPDRTH